MLHDRSRRTTVGLACAIVLSTIAAACGSSTKSSSSTVPAGSTPIATTTPAAGTIATPAGSAAASAAGPTTAAGSTNPAGSATPAANSAAWDDVIAKAKKEGTVTIYSSQSLDQLNDLATRFKAAYGITVTVVRDIDGNIQVKAQAEHDASKGIGDVIVQATASWDVKESAAGLFTTFSGPAIDDPNYDKANNVSPKADYLVASAAVLTFGWNTAQYPKGLKDYPDLLDPALKGQIGVIEPSAASIVDFWLYLEGKYGKDFTDKLAAQNPKIYASSLPMGQAMASGEISAALFVGIQTDAKKTGAPVDSGLSDTVWGALFKESVLATSPHPNAAQLLANFILTEPGQEALARLAGSVLPNVPGAVTTTSKVHKQDLSILTPDFVAAYQARWNGLFKH